jgi:hypothetical protein
MSGELVTKGGQRVVKGRVSPALRTALTLIVEQGLTQGEAAQRVGMKGPSLTIALRKPHVRAAKEAVKRAWLASRTDKAWLTMAQLADGAASEDVRHKSAKVFLDAAGELGSVAAGDGGPRQLVQIVLHNALQAGQPIAHRLPGIIEQQAPQRMRPDPSNLIAVGRSSTAPCEAGS